MKAIHFPEHNRVFRRPEGMTEEECQDLQVHDTGEALVSVWEPTEEERAAIAAGGPVYLWIIGRSHPVVALSAENPFTTVPVQ